MRVPRFITAASFSSPSVNLILSTAVSIVGKVDTIAGGVDRREGAVYPPRRHSFLEGGVALRIECLGVGHSSAHPKNNPRVRRALYPGGIRRIGTNQLPWKPGGQR